MNTIFTSNKFILLFILSFFLYERSEAQCSAVTSFSYIETPIGGTGNCTYAFSINVTNGGGGNKCLVISISIGGGTPSTTSWSVGGTGTITSISLTGPCGSNVELSYEGHSNNSCNNNSVCQPLIVLPIVIIDYKLSRKSEGIMALWKVSEYNVKSYDLMHSTDGQNWRHITSLKALGRGEASYEYLHSNPNAGNNYYKFITNDFDGRTSESKILMTRWDVANTKEINLYPNTIDQSATLILGNKWLDNTDQQLTIDIFNYLGQKVNTQIKPIAKQIDLDFSSLHAGNYVLVLRNNSIEKVYCKFIKL